MPYSRFREEYLALLNAIKAKSAKPDLKLVKKAFLFSFQAHKSQKRLSGEQFFTHPLDTALRLADWGMDSETIAAGLLHDCLEDTETSEQNLKRRFGPGVLELVKGVSKLAIIASKTRKSQKRVEDLEKLLLAASKDLRVLIIKLADKIHNLQTLQHLPRPDRERIALEALTVYAPLAHKLSMHRVKFEIEDLAFKTLHPERFEELKKLANSKKRLLEKHSGILQAKLKAECSKAGIPVMFSKSLKSTFAMDQKCQHTGKEPMEIEDFLIIYILTTTPENCYSILGKLHSLFKPVPGKFKDFIAVPEHGLYQALHTKVIGPNGQKVKCYISTFEMLETANYGIICFFRNPGMKNKKLLHEKLEWLQSFLKPSLLKDRKFFMEVLDLELKRDITVFTPKGDPIVLPFGSTSIDFAYSIHTTLGNHCWKSIVNGKEQSIEKALNAGETVRIIGSEKPRLRQEWLSLLKSPRAIVALKKGLKNQKASNNRRV